jgi:hypothetical protein
VKVTLIVQLADGARVVPQLLVSAKSVLALPVTAMLEMLKLALPVLVKVTDWAGLVVPAA